MVSKHDQKGKRVITEKGLDALSSVLVSKRVGFVTTRFLLMASSVAYYPNSNTGKVVANVLVMGKKFCDKALELVELLNSADLLLAPHVKVIEGSLCWAYVWASSSSSSGAKEGGKGTGPGRGLRGQAPEHGQGTAHEMEQHACTSRTHTR